MSDSGARRRARIERLLLGALGFVLVLFLITPLLMLVVTMSWRELLEGLEHPMVGQALRLSLFTTAITLVVVVVFGTPLAWLLARARGRLGRMLETLLQLPVVVPPAVAGLALLLTFGRRSALSRGLFDGTLSLTSTTTAVVLAEVFVSAPFFLQAATSAFRRVDPGTLLVARSLGASPAVVFLRVGVPLALPGIAAGAAMSWARALGEFGATLMFAGNLEGRTQTLPLAIYSALEADLRAAQAIAILLSATAFALLLAVRGASARFAHRREEAG